MSAEKLLRAFAEAFSAFGNDAITAMHNGTADVACIASGMQAVAWRLEEIAKENAEADPVGEADELPMEVDPLGWARRHAPENLPPNAIGSGAKTLEWSGDYADTSIGRYAIRRTPDGYGVLVDGEEIAHLGYDAPREQPSACDAARDYAQADFERRVLSCPSPVAVEEAGAEAVGDCANCDGEGWAYSDLEGRTEECHRCNGTGKEDAASTPSPQIGKAGAGPVGEAVAWRALEGPIRGLGFDRGGFEFIFVGDRKFTQEEVRAALARPVEEPGEVERLTRERDEAVSRYASAVKDAAEQRALAERRRVTIAEYMNDEKLRSAEAAIAEMRAAINAALRRGDVGSHSARLLRAALTGDAQEAGR